jgi:hypothetical protein
MLIAEKKIRSIIRKILLQEADVKLSSRDKENIYGMARNLVLKIPKNKKHNEQEERSNVNVVTGHVRSGDNDQAMGILLNGFSEETKKLDEYQALLQFFKMKTGAKKGEGQAEKDDDGGDKKKEPKADNNVSEIQQKLNALNFKDYRGKSLTVDGKWGKATRSATSKMLKMIDEGGKPPEKGLFKKLNLNLLANDPLFGKLATGSKGPGSWKKLAIKLVEGKPFYDGGGKYPAVLAILDRFEASNLDGSSVPEQEGEFVSPNELPKRPKGQTWYEYYGRKDVQNTLLEMFNKRYGIEIKTQMPIERDGTNPYTNFGDRYLSGEEPKNYDPVKGSEKGAFSDMPGVIRLMMPQIKNKDGKFEPFGIGILGIRFNGSVGTRGGSFEGGTKKQVIEQIKAVGGKADMFVKEWNVAKTGSPDAVRMGTGLEQDY